MAAKVSALRSENRELEKEIARLKQKLATSAGGDLTAGAVEVAGVKVLAANVEGADPKSLRDTLDQCKNKLGSAVILLAAATTTTENRRLRPSSTVWHINRVSRFSGHYLFH